jgi:hypothetical protein
VKGKSKKEQLTPGGGVLKKHLKEHEEEKWIADGGG